MNNHNGKLKKPTGCPRVRRPRFRAVRWQVELQAEPFRATAPPDGTVPSASGSEYPNDPPVANPIEARRIPPIDDAPRNIRVAFAELGPDPLDRPSIVPLPTTLPSPTMPKTTRTYWNPLSNEHRGNWQPIEGLEGMAEELTLAIDKPPPTHFHHPNQP